MSETEFTRKREFLLDYLGDLITAIENSEWVIDRFNIENESVGCTKKEDEFARSILTGYTRINMRVLDLKCQEEMRKFFGEGRE